jgi:predicted CXXCH cytochrome family protein
MKKSLVICLAVSLVLAFGTIALAGTSPGTGIKESAHDLSSGGRGASWDAGIAADPTLDRVCIYCHAPHHAIKAGNAGFSTLTYYPLWNHAVTNIASFETYTNGIETPNSPAHMLNADIGQPGGVSRLCLSCHDGSMAISTYGFNDASSSHVGSINASGRILIGGSGILKNHHPIGFDYDAVAAIDDEINDSSTSLLGANVWGLTISDLLWNGKMECSSCHDVHNTKNEGQRFTWVEDTRSNLCFSCHNK